MTHRRWTVGRWAILAGAACGVLFGALSGVARAEPLPNDERNVHGKLDNGVSWVYRQHDNPPDKMALFVHVRTGSLNETDAQRGLAHFIEHMCFNGSEHYPPGTLIKYFESIGMEFGADLNAYTSFDETVYMLFLPDTTAEEIDKGLMTLSDYVFRASFIGEEIDKERGVVMAEWRTGQGARQRVQDQEFKQVFAGVRFSERLPIGLPEIIENAPHEQLVKYYHTWYRPERITVIGVGDTPVKDFTPAVKKWFGEFKSDTPADDAQSAGFKPFAVERAFVITDPELGGCSIEVIAIEPGRPPVTTVEQARQELVEGVGTWMVTRRLHERVQKGEAAYERAGAQVGDFFHDAVVVSARANGDADDWAKMLDELIVEVVRARTHGFTESELQLARKEIIADVQRAVETEPTRNARSILREIAEGVNDREPVPSAQQQFEIAERLLPTLQLEEVNAAFAKHFNSKAFAYIVEMPEKEGIDIPSTEAVLKLAQAAMAKQPEPFNKAETPTDLLAEAPTPGKVVESVTDDDLQITSAWLDNGARVHHRFMDYKKDTVLVNVLLMGGQIEETPETLGLTQVADAALRRQPATSRLTSTNVRDIMTGMKIEVSTRASDDSLNFRVVGAPEELETGLQLVHALLADGKIEDSAVKVWKQRDKQRRAMLARVARFKVLEALSDALYGGDPRHQPLLPEARVEAITAADAQAWYDRIRTTAPIEVAIVGEVKRDEAMRLIEKYIGSLPKRERSAPRLDTLRAVNRPEGPLVRDIRVDTITDKAATAAGFVGCNETEVYDLRALELASHVLSSRLIETIREKMSLVYSLRAWNQPGTAYRDSGAFLTEAPCAPDKAAQVVGEIKKIYQAFATDGPSEEELANAKKQIENNLDEEMREPDYWLGVLADLDYHGRKLADEKAEPTAYQAYTVEDVVKVFRKYFTPQRTFQATAIPTGKDNVDTATQKAAEQPSS